MDKPTLSTPRSLLTSLLTTLTSSTIQSSTSPTHPPQAPLQTQQQEVNPPYGQYNQPTNPLKSLSPSQRAILSTLHVVLPTGVLLQSLDLLDRGLIVRVIEEGSGQCGNGNGKGDDGNEERVGKNVVPPQAHVHLPESEGQAQAGNERNDAGNKTDRKSKEDQKPKRRKNVSYLVRSSQAPKSRFKDRGTGFNDAGSLTYTVRLKSWNCSCAAFAFESFPGYSIADGQKPWLDLSGESDADQDEENKRRDGQSGENGEGDGGKDGEWEFGGLSSDGKGEGEGVKVPVCKHLIACLLAERWEGVLGSYVKERVVGREEMAGVGGEG